MFSICEKNAKMSPFFHTDVNFTLYYSYRFYYHVSNKSELLTPSNKAVYTFCWAMPSNKLKKLYLIPKMTVRTFFS